MELTFDITLEHIDGGNQCHTFRLAFHNSTARILLPYPDETGLRFSNAKGEETGTWETPFLVSGPLDDFVLSHESRIAFDIKAHINQEPGAEFNPRWAIQLPAGAYNAQFIYQVKPDVERYDFLAKRSRFAAITSQWSGSVISNVVQFTIAESSDEKAN